MSARLGLGLGARAGFRAEELADFAREVAARHGADLRGVTLGLLADMREAREFARVAEFCEMRCVSFSREALQTKRTDVLTHSLRVNNLYGVGSLAEALALLAAGDSARLVAARAANDRFTCALARSNES